MNEPRMVPTSGQQLMVKYCPNCKGDLRIIDPEKPHCYKCDVCDWRFEINYLDRKRSEK